jgi:hypothetical protein
LCDRYSFYKFPCKHVDKFDTPNTDNLSEKEFEVPQKTLAELHTYGCLLLKLVKFTILSNFLSEILGLFGDFLRRYEDKLLVLK